MWCKGLCSGCVCILWWDFLASVSQGNFNCCVALHAPQASTWMLLVLQISSDIFIWIFRLPRRCIGFFSFRALVFATIAKSFARSVASNQSRMNVFAQFIIIDLGQFQNQLVSYELGRLAWRHCTIEDIIRGVETQGRKESTSKSFLNKKWLLKRSSFVELRQQKYTATKAGMLCSFASVPWQRPGGQDGPQLPTESRKP